MNIMVRSFFRISIFDCERIMGFDDKFSNLIFLVLRVIKEWIYGLMCILIIVEEDKVFLVVVEWDGFGGLGISEFGCLFCCW